MEGAEGGDDSFLMIEETGGRRETPWEERNESTLFSSLTAPNGPSPAPLGLLAPEPGKTT